MNIINIRIVVTFSQEGRSYNWERADRRASGAGNVS